MRAIVIFLLASALAGPGRAQAPKISADDADFFESRIRPLLAARCFECHSAKAAKLRGNLRLDTREGTLQGGDQGPALVPGDPDRSLLVKAIRQEDDELK